MIRIFDDHFVKSEEYANLLIDEIPERQKVNIAISVILQRQTGDIYNLSLFLKCLISRMEKEEIDRLYNVISEEIKHTESSIDINTILSCCPAEHWSKINRAIRLRIENIIKKDIENGNYNVENDKCYGGALGTWVTKTHFELFNDHDSWTHLFIRKLESIDSAEREYILRYHWFNLVHLNKKKMNSSLKFFLKNALKENNDIIREKLRVTIQFDKLHPWWEELKNEIKKYTNIELQEVEEIF